MANKTLQKQLNLENIRAIKVIGKGALGTVFLAHDAATDPAARSPFALKVVDISAQQRGGACRARWETAVLSSLSHHPFLPTLVGSFEAHDLLGWAVPYCPGGDLNSLRYIHADHVFSISAIRFYLAEIICALDHLHAMGIAYRDLKPENVLVQGSGHVTLTDFDLSVKLTPRRENQVGSASGSDPGPGPGPVRIGFAMSFSNGLKKAKLARVSPVSRPKASVNQGSSDVLSLPCQKVSFIGTEMSNSFVGTEEYVSPEVVKEDGHAFAVDWWALGVLAYEMLYGKTPFQGKDRKETFRNVLTKRVEFVRKRMALMDLIERLLEKDASKRLGSYRGAEEIEEHEFFKGLRWDLLTEVQRPPFVPSTEDVEGLTERVTFDVRGYFKKLRAPASFPWSPVQSFSSEEEDERHVSQITKL